MKKSRLLTNREIVIETMHFNGKLNHLLTPEQWINAYLLCDGFGGIDYGFAKEQCFDWSHVRDSSEEALEVVAKFILSKN